MIPDFIFGMFYRLFDMLISSLPDMPNSKLDQTKLYDWLMVAAYYLPMDTLFQVLTTFVTVISGLIVWRIIRFIRGG